MMVRWMCEVSLKDRKRSVESVGRWRWRGRDVRGGKGRLGKNVWIKT